MKYCCLQLQTVKSGVLGEQMTCPSHKLNRRIRAETHLVNLVARAPLWATLGFKWLLKKKHWAAENQPLLGPGVSKSTPVRRATTRSKMLPQMIPENNLCLGIHCLATKKECSTSFQSPSYANYSSSASGHPQAKSIWHLKPAKDIFLL